MPWVEGQSGDLWGPQHSRGTFHTPLFFPLWLQRLEKKEGQGIPSRMDSRHPPSILPRDSSSNPRPYPPHHPRSDPELHLASKLCGLWRPASASVGSPGSGGKSLGSGILRSKKHGVNLESQGFGEELDAMPPLVPVTH